MTHTWGEMPEKDETIGNKRAVGRLDDEQLSLEKVIDECRLDLTLQDAQDWIHGVGSRTDGEWLCCYCLVAQSSLILCNPVGL